MRLSAIGLGEAIPRTDFDARVHSVFDSTVNLALTASDRLITVFASQTVELPQGIRLTTPAGLFQSLRVDAAAHARAGVLSFTTSPYTIDLRRAPIWRCRLRALGADLTHPGARRAWCSAFRGLCEAQHQGAAELVASDVLGRSGGSLLSQRVRLAVRVLRRAVRCFDVDAAVRAAAGLLGIGPGLTPSGDDVLIGLVTGWWAVSARDPQRLAFIRGFGAGIARCTFSTGAISRVYLAHAAAGRCASSLADLARAIGDGCRIAPTLRVALRSGHTSGMDSVTGLLIGLRAWDGGAVRART